MPTSPVTPKVAIVTGASRGLGKLTAHDLAEREWQVVTCSTSDRGPGVGEAIHRRADVRDARAVDALVEAALSRWGKVDVLVNNAGYANAPAPVAGTDAQEVLRCFEVNLLGPYHVLRRVLPGMLERPEGGVVINIASRAAVVPVPGLAAYSASKSALVSLTLALAKEVGERPVLCVSVCPAGMDTQMRTAIYGAEDARRQLDPQRVADVVVEVATRRTLNGGPLRSGAAVLVTQDGRARVVPWPRDERGHEGLVLG
ncbi:MAG: SDR family oxidoreductase [Thermoplasmata archaeon]